MARYIALPVEIEAFRLYQDDAPEWFVLKMDQGSIRAREHHFEIDTLEGTMIATKDDYIILGTHKEIYPCKAEIFEKKYVLSEKQ